MTKKKQPEQEIATPQEADFNSRFKSNFYDYGMSVIRERALPDVRDGLKPVHRAIVYEMLQSRILSSHKTVKVKRIVGNVIGKWHPHGDSAAELALDGLSQEWINPLPILYIKGNNGSIFGDTPASGRYTEARLTPAGDAYGHNLKEGIVPYVPNFDDTEKMPEILPAQLPYLLINGITEGIAVGVASTLPPHNPREVVDMVLHYLRKPKSKTEELLEIMPGPDFPSGATIINKEDLLSIYETGRGKIRIRATLEYDEKEHAIHVREVPFTFSGSVDALVAELVNATTETVNSQKKKVPPKITGINSVNNYSDKNGIDICIELARGVNGQEMIQTLLAKTRLEVPITVQFAALNAKQLHLYSLRRYLAEYVDFQHEIVSNEYQLKLEELNRRAEILMGHIIAASYIDEIVDVVKHAENRAQIEDVLMHGTILPGTKKTYQKTVSSFQFTPLQAEAISGRPLYQLNRLDTQKLVKEGQEIQKAQEKARKMVENRSYRHKEIIRRLEEEKKKLPDTPRKTRIVSEAPAKVSVAETPAVDLYVGMDHYGYVRIESAPFDGSQKTDSKSRVGFFDATGNCWNLFLDRVKETKGRGTLLSQLIDGLTDCIGFTTEIREDSDREGLFLFMDGALRRIPMKQYWTKTRATKVKTQTENHPLTAYQDIPEDVNVVAFDENKIPLRQIPQTGRSGNGTKLLPEKEEPYAISFTKEDLPEEPEAKKPNGFDGLAIFTEDGKLKFDWSTLDPAGQEGLYITTYQNLIQETLLFVHTDGTAKRVDGSQFAVKTKRTSIAADKDGVKILDIRPATDETLIGTYTEGKQKRIKVSDISMQGKTGGGIRVFYTTKYTLLSVESGEGSNLPVVSFATLPK